MTWPGRARTVALEPRTVQVFEARLLGDARSGPCRVRNPLWQRDLRPVLGARSGPGLGTVGHVSPLRRTRIGGFYEEDAIALETLTPFMHSPAAFEHLRPISTALDGIPALAVTGPDAVRLRSGNPILIRANSFARITEGQSAGDDLQGLTVFLSTTRGRASGIGRIRRRASFGRFVYSTFRTR